MKKYPGVVLILVFAILISCDDSNSANKVAQGNVGILWANSSISNSLVLVVESENEIVSDSSLAYDYGNVIPYQESKKSDLFPAPVHMLDESILYGFSTETENFVIEPKFDLAGDFYGGIAPVILNGTHGFCDTTGKMIYKLINYEFSIFHNELSGEDFIKGAGEGFFMVMNEDGKCGYVNSKDKLVVPCIYDDGLGFSNGRALVNKNDLFGFIDTSGNVIVKPKYEMAYPFSDSLACVQVKDKRGFIDLSGKLVIPTIYTEAYYFKEGLCYVTKSTDYSNYYYIDKTGKTIIPGPFEQAASFENGEALVLKRGKCRIIDKTGTQLRSAGSHCFGGC